MSQPLAHHAKYFPALLDSYRKLPLNSALQHYQKALLARIDSIRSEVAADPDRYSALPPAIAHAALQKAHRAQDREAQWHQILQEFHQKNTDLATKLNQRKPLKEQWQCELDQEARALSLKKAVRKAAVFVDRLQSLKFIEGREEWRAAIEAALDAPVSHEDARMERVVAKRDRIEAELEGAFVREIRDLVREIGA